MDLGSSSQDRSPVAVTIGSFDGVHMGHRRLIQVARDRVGQAGKVVALSFFPHPMSKLRPEAAPARLTAFDRRVELLREAGADEVEALEPTADLLGRRPEAFVDWVVERYAPLVFVEGPDFRFGKARSGDNEKLRAIGERVGFDVEVVDEVDVSLADQSIVRASSTVVRWLLEQGRVGDAACVLGRPHLVSGIVRRGDQRGRLLGYPTANIETQTMLPRDGIYAGDATLPDGTVRPAAIHIGPRATFNRMNRTMEVFVVDWAGPVAEGLEEYGWPISVRFSAWLRDQAKYDSAAGLCVQMARDVERASTLFESHPEGVGG